MHVHMPPYCVCVCARTHVCTATYACVHAHMWRKVHVLHWSPHFHYMHCVRQTSNTWCMVTSGLQHRKCMMLYVVLAHKWEEVCTAIHLIAILCMPATGSSTSKSSTMSFVSSVPFRLPTAHTSLVLLALMRHTTPPLPPLSSAIRLRKNSPVRKSQILTVPSSEDVMTNFLLNCRQVTALWCLFGPEKKEWTYYQPRYFWTTTLLAKSLYKTIIIYTVE